jgi:hypothetical protein
MDCYRQTDIIRFYKAIISDQIGSGAHLAYYPMHNRDSFPGGKAVGK